MTKKLGGLLFWTTLCVCIYIMYMLMLQLHVELDRGEMRDEIY